MGDRNNVTVISQETGDPSAVVFDAINSAKAKNIDIINEFFNRNFY